MSLVFFLGMHSALYAQNESIYADTYGSELIGEIRTNYYPSSIKSYDTARDSMYISLDVTPGGKIICVYTGLEVTADGSRTPGSPGAELNTEHVWPQGFFDSASPMVSDIHHLFPTWQTVNSIRGSLKFAEIPDVDTDKWLYDGNESTSIPGSNIDLYSESTTTAFEPREDFKGNIARAIFYFWTLYQNNSDIVAEGTNEAFFADMKETLYDWHIQDPVDAAEVARSSGIESIQGNRNPFIHDTTLIRRAYIDTVASTNGETSEEISFREISFRLDASNGAADYSNKLYFHENGTEEQDAYDGSKLASISPGNPYMFFVQNFGEGEVELVQDARNLYPDTIQTYNLEVEDAGFSGTLTISWQNFKNIPDLWKLWLVDTDLDSTINMVDDSEYSFTTSRNFQVRIEPITSQVVISGDAGWRLLSFPVTGASATQLTDDTAIQGITGGENTTADPNLYINLASDGTAGNGYSVPSDIYSAWGDGYGFLTYFFDNDVAGSSELPITIDAMGKEPEGDVTLSISDTFTLAGNPFLSNLDLDEISGNGSGGTNGGLQSPIYYYDSNGLNTANFGTGAIISNWSGFFIQRSGSSTTELTIPVSAKTEDSSTAGSFSKEKNPSFREIELHLESPGSLVDRSAKLFFHEAASQSIDAFDGNRLYPIDGRPFLAFSHTEGDSIKLLVQDARAFNPEKEERYKLIVNDQGVSGVYTLSWPELRNIPDQWELKFLDLETGESVSMRDYEFYNFEIESASQKPLKKQPGLFKQAEASTELAPRFKIVIASAQATKNEFEDTPVTHRLEQNYPNPFNPTTTIRYSLSEPGRVTLSIFNVMGQKVDTIIDESKTSGAYQITWDARNFASGVYYYQLKVSDQVITKKMTLIK